MDSLVLQTALGLVFVFATFAGLVSVLTELLTRFIGLRGEYMLRGIRSLVDGPGKFELPYSLIFNRKPAPPLPEPDKAETPIVTQIMNHPLVSATADKATMPPDAGDTKLTNQQRRKLPSYVSGRSFARALIDVIAPDSRGRTSISDIRAALAGSGSSTMSARLREPLQALATNAGDDFAAFTKGVEQWYDDHMARVSGWYKRHVRWISLALGAVLVIAFNLSVISIARSLYTDQALRGSVVTQATQASQCGSKDPATCLRDLRNELDSVRSAGLPIGWGTVAACTARDCNWLAEQGLIEPDRTVGRQSLDALIAVLGWTMMVIALLPGARFWFDALGKLGTLRSTGPKPATS